jgi:hypothetical protein
MATGSGYGAYQLSTKAGNDLLNIAADSADQLRERIDALFGEDASDVVLGKFFVVTAFEAPEQTSTNLTYVTTGPTVTTTQVGNGDSPTPKQIKFAQSLGIQNAESLDRRQLSAEIDKRTGGRKR